MSKRCRYTDIVLAAMMVCPAIFWAASSRAEIDNHCMSGISCTETACHPNPGGNGYYQCHTSNNAEKALKCNSGFGISSGANCGMTWSSTRSDCSNAYAPTNATGCGGGTYVGNMGYSCTQS